MMKKFSSLLLSLLSLGLVQAQTLTVTNTPTNPSCGNANSGSAIINVSGCAGPYTYTVNGGASQVSANSPINLSNLAAGNYTVNVTAPGGGGGTQTIFQDNFDGAVQWTLNTAIGTQDPESNIWIIDDLESWDGVCGSGNLVTSGDKTLHIYCNSQFCSLFGTGAIYDAGGVFTSTTTDKFTSTTNNINTTGLTNIHVKFGWRCVGQANADYGLLRYSINGGTNWIDLPTKYQSQSNWACADVTLPATCENISTLKIGFRWINNNDGTGSDPTFAIDDVVVTGSGSGGSQCTGSTTFTLTNSGTFTPSTNLTGAQSICPGETLTITAVSGQNCTWNTTPSQSGQSIVVSAPGSYACTCQDQTGTCSGTSLPVNVTQAPPPVGGFSYAQIDNYTVEFTSTSTGGTQFDWIFPNAPTTGSGATIQHDFPSQGSYTVSLIVSSNCGSDTIEQDIVVLKVGIDESSVFSKFDLFPNPAQGQAMLQLGAVKPFEGTIKIVNPLGQIITDEVAKFTASYAKVIDTATLANGVYSVVIINEDGVFSRRLVVSN